MKNKIILVLLGITLLLTIILLAIYAYSLSKKPIVQPLVSSQFQPALDNSSNKANKELEAIKKEMGDIDKKIPAPEDCSEEASAKYEEEVKTGGTKTATGVILAVKGSFLTVNFKLGSESWVSEVGVDKQTSIMIPASSNNSTAQNISLSDIKVGDKVLINVLGNIYNNSAFTAFSIFKIN